MWILVVLLLLLLLFLFLIWLLWTRMVICINSFHGQYYFRFGRLITVTPMEEEDKLVVRVKVPFYKFNIDPQCGTKKERKPKKRKKPRRDTGRKLGMSFYLKTVVGALKTFTVRRFELDLDTGDFVLNAQLTPVMVLLSRGPAHLQVNYQGHANLWIEIENQLVRFVPLIFRFVREKYL